MAASEILIIYEVCIIILKLRIIPPRMFTLGLFSSFFFVLFKPCCHSVA